MTRRPLAGWLIGALLLGWASPVGACSLCGGNLKQTPTLREEAGRPEAQLIFAGTAVESKTEPGGLGKTTFRVDEVLRPHPILGKKKTIVVPRYIPIADPKKPPHYLLICDVFNNRLDPYRGVAMKTDALPGYLRKGMALDEKDVAGKLAYYFGYLEHPDPEIAQDAFVEFAKATDKDIGQAAARFSPQKLRLWLTRPKTPAARLSVYAVLLGACGNADDARLLRSKIDAPAERYRNAIDGLLTGYINLRPREGWKLAIDILGDPRQPLQVRLAVEKALNFYQNWQPRKSRPHLLKAASVMLSQGDLGDLAIEDLRRWEVWELTDAIVALYGKGKYTSAVKKRAILRYALTCKPTAASTAFLADRRRAEPETVKDIEEFLKFEKP
jgi:hypothetical protein